MTQSHMNVVALILLKSIAHERKSVRHYEQKATEYRNDPSRKVFMDAKAQEHGRRVKEHQAAFDALSMHFSECSFSQE